MIKRIFTVFDTKAKTYNDPWLCATEDVAVRTFARAANDETTEIYHNPEDFVLFCLGEWDNQDAQFHPTQPNCIARAHELKKGKE